jgi:putative ABC transport system permease protein
MVTTRVMDLTFEWLPGPAVTATAAALVITIAFGLIGTLSALSQKPAPVLRNL